MSDQCRHSFAVRIRKEEREDSSIVVDVELPLIGGARGGGEGGEGQKSEKYFYLYLNIIEWDR